MNPMDTAPRDGTPILAEIPGHGDDNLIAWGCVGYDDNLDDAYGWFFVSPQEPPECWTDGVCWAVNENGQASVFPTRWRPAL